MNPNKSSKSKPKQKRTLEILSLKIWQRITNQKIKYNIKTKI